MGFLSIIIRNGGRAVTHTVSFHVHCYGVWYNKLQSRPADRDSVADIYSFTWLKRKKECMGLQTSTYEVALPCFQLASPIEFEAITHLESQRIGSTSYTLHQSAGLEATLVFSLKILANSMLSAQHA